MFGLVTISSLQATFKITLENVPIELTALSNMPILEEKLDGHLKTVYFEESVVMSTYLVAVVVGLYDHIKDITDDGMHKYIVEGMLY